MVFHPLLPHPYAQVHYGRTPVFSLVAALLGDRSLQNIVQLAVETTQKMVLGGRACLWGGGGRAWGDPSQGIEGEKLQ